MRKNEIETIERAIGYEFKNKSLLQQAFTRRSYSEEAGVSYSNEILEFIGDRVLEIIVVRHFAENNAKIDGDGFLRSEYTEGDFTEIKSIMVDGSMLAYRIGVLGLNKYLVMSKGDVKKNVQEENSVKEDLFEAILGAVALDCNWNLDELFKVVQKMLYAENDLAGNIICNLRYENIINAWCRRTGRPLPYYEYRNNVLADPYEKFLPRICYMSVEGVEEEVCAEGRTDHEARANACCKFYDYLLYKKLLPTLLDEVGKPDFENSVNQLQELWQKGYIAKPEYVFEHKIVVNGNSEWTCKCIVDGIDVYARSTDSKKIDAKKDAAFNMLVEIFYEYDVDWDEYIPDPFDYDNDDI